MRFRRRINSAGSAGTPSEKSRITGTKLGRPGSRGEFARCSAVPRGSPRDSFCFKSSAARCTVIWTGNVSPTSKPIAIGKHVHFEVARSLRVANGRATEQTVRPRRDACLSNSSSCEVSGRASFSSSFVGGFETCRSSRSFSQFWPLHRFPASSYHRVFHFRSVRLNVGSVVFFDKTRPVWLSHDLFESTIFRFSTGCHRERTHAAPSTGCVDRR